jgi:hypothetical protein
VAVPAVSPLPFPLTPFLLFAGVTQYSQKRAFGGFRDGSSDQVPIDCIPGACLRRRFLMRKIGRYEALRCQISRLRGNMKTLIYSFALLSFAFPAWAAHPFHVEDMQRLSRVGGPRVSPDGKWVAFTATRSDVAKNRSVTNIWTIPSPTCDRRRSAANDDCSDGS